MRTIIVIFGLLSLMFAASVPAAENCDSIIEREGNIWIVDQSGTSTPITTDAPEPRLRAAVWSPDGKYIAYAPSPKGGNNKGKFIVISDRQGQQKVRLVVEPEQKVGTIRYIDKIIWTAPNILISEGVAGRFGLALDIYELSNDLSQSKHLKKIMTYYCGEYVLSDDLKTVACIHRNEEVGNFLEINDVGSYYEEAIMAWEDPKPRRIPLNKVRLDYPCKLGFLPSKDRILLTSQNATYEVDLKTNDVRDLKKSIEEKTSHKPEYIKIKIKDDQKTKEYDVFDAFCYDKAQE